MNIDEGLFDREEFIKWLEAQEDESIVGKGADPCDCPLARWLRSKRLHAEIMDYRALIADESVIAIPYPRVSVKLPIWAFQFVEDIDASCGHLSVTKEDALEQLEVYE